MKANRLLLRTLTRTASSLSSPSLNFSSSAPKSAAKTPRKKWKMVIGDPPPAVAAVKSQPPKTIQFSDDICNSASFVGTVTGPMQRIIAPGGRVGACTSLLVKGSPDDNCSFKIILKTWDEMAEMCLDHIKQNDVLHVSGRVNSYTKTDEIGKSQMCCEVIVKEINYVAESEYITINKSIGLSDSGESEYSSIDKSASPITKNAGKPEHSPINKNAGKLESGGLYGSEKHTARLILWKQFFTNPSEWYDNRAKKLKLSNPDFKHKDSGEALWINDNDPPWLKEKLQQLDSKLVAQDHKPPTESEYSSIDKSAGLSEHSPISKNAGKSEQSAINKNAGKSESGGVYGSEKHKARLLLWEQFFTNPSEWYDNRAKKSKPSNPDFKHKDSGEVLWINDNDPPWLKEKLQQLDSNLVAQDHKPPTGKSLTQHPGESGLEKYRARLRLWQMFFTNPSQWHDNRSKKVKPNQPDFKHKDNGEALWISPRDPPWVKIQLEKLDS